MPFYFDGEEPEGWQAALAEFNEKTCIRFVKDQQDQQGLRNKVSVRTRSEPKVCGAGVGMAESGLNKVFLAKPWCWGKGKQDNDMVTVLYCAEGTIQHELLHVLGFSHEQNRRDRNQFVRVHFENLRDGVERNFQIFPDGLLCSPYDYCSVMHYSQKAFSVSPITTDSQIRAENILQKNDKPTIEPLRSVSGCPGLGQRTGMSGATNR